MSDRVRNIIVGLTILVALVLCMYGIFLLGKGPTLSTLRQYKITVITPNANGIAPSAKVLLAGIQVGQVLSTDLMTDPQSGALGAKVTLLINNDINIPVTATASITRSATGVGNPTVDLTASSGKGGPLPKDGSGKIIVTSVETNPLAGLIPQSVFEDISALRMDLGTAAHGLTTVTQDLHVLLAYTPPEVIDNANPNDANRPKENASTVIIRLDRTIKSLQGLVGDPELQANVRSAIANIEAASAQFKETLKKADAAVDNANGAIANISTAANSIGGAATKANAVLGSVQKDFDNVSSQLVSTLAQLEETTRRISDGKGTAGLLVNDPRLYENLVDLSQSLKKSSEDLDILIKKWQEEGVDFHLGNK